MNELKRLLSSVIYQLYANVLLKGLFLALSMYFIASTVFSTSALSVLTGVLGLGAGLFYHKIYRTKKPQAIALIHKTIGDTEYSLSLLDKAEVNIAERLQLERLSQAAGRVRIPTVVFSQIGLYALLLGVSLLFHYAYPAIWSEPKELVKKTDIPALAAEERPAASAFRSAELRILPPAYTGLPEQYTRDLNVSAISGSLLTWRLRFSDQRGLRVRLADSRGEEVAFRQSGDTFEYRDRLVNSGLYAIKAYWNDSLVYQSDYYRLEARPDLAPKIQPDSKELYRYHFLNDPKTITVSARISDDFGVAQAFLVATLARGSGENVKFREVKIPLGTGPFKEDKRTKVIDLKSLNFAPGDELYYYWAAIDNKQPEPNFAKSDTYFVVYKDTTQLDEAELATMAVNVMPEYFRSQRQIIIDTEKLIAKRRKLTKPAFNSESNEIGFDQKVLRLRYGQYLGEEFENTIGHSAGEHEGEGNPLEGFVHRHDTEVEGAHEHEEEDHKDHQEAEAHGHTHAHSSPTGTGGEKDPVAALMEEFVHSHDDAEANTFYEQSTRSLLKMALEQMWQSELHLRLYEPEKALPFEKKALVYLKSAQQKARAFVKKTGFAPPPIKEKETRLTGELKNVIPSFRQERLDHRQRLEPLVARTLGYLEQAGPLKPEQKRTVQQLGSYLTVYIMTSGLATWSILRSLQKLAGGTALTVIEKRQLKTKLYRLTGRSGQTTPDAPFFAGERKLEQAFWTNLK